MQEQHQGPDLFRLIKDGEVPNGHSPPTDQSPCYIALTVFLKCVHIPPLLSPWRPHSFLATSDVCILDLVSHWQLPKPVISGDL